MVMSYMNEGPVVQGYTMDRLSVQDGGLYADHDEVLGGVQTDGTTIMSMKYKGGILMGADARSANVSPLEWKPWAFGMGINHVFVIMRDTEYVRRK